jgi:uncharacterized membrane protein
VKPPHVDDEETQQLEKVVDDREPPPEVEEAVEADEAQEAQEPQPPESGDREEEEERPEAEPARRGLRARHWVLLATGLSSLLILLGPTLRITDDPAGLWLIIGAPIGIYYGTARRVVSTPDGAALLSLGFAILHDILVLLGLDLLLPLAGDKRPLELMPITLAFTLAAILVGAFAPEGEPLDLAPGWWRGRGYGPVLGLGAAILLLSVAGPIRLNNGFGSGVSITAMVVIVASLLLLLFKPGYAKGAAQLGIYFAATGILLLTSLRGWLITGHDIQTEYAYFSDVLNSGRWQPGQSQNAYYACLSVTMLPVAFTHLTAVSDINVFKVLEPLLFATTPVLLFRSVRNVAPHSVAMLSAIFFIIFPTFSTDMTYMSRQEIAFILVGCSMLLVTEQRTGLTSRRIAFGALMIGIVLAHYSTAYVVIIVCAIAVAGDLAMRAWQRIRGRGKEAGESGKRRRRASRSVVADHGATAFVSWWLFGLTVVAAYAWAGPITDTGNQVQATVSAALAQLHGNATSGYFAPQETGAQLLSGYKKAAVATTAPDRAKGVYWPLSLVDQYSTPTVDTQYQPLTGVGRRIQALGIDVTTGNVLARSLDDRIYEGLIVVGLLGAWFARRRQFVPTMDQVLLALGGLGMLVVLTVIPQLSVDYGILRAFEEAMFFLAPFMAAGLIGICALLRQAFKPAVGVSLAVVASTMTGVVPQLTGGYLGILSMADEGQYYDIHYPTPAELAGAEWLESLVGTTKSRTGRTPVVQTDYFTSDMMQTVFTGPSIPDILPQWLRPSSYVFVGSTMIRTGQVSNRINGTTVTYTYPKQLLDTEYNKIYASSGAEVYGPEMNN